MHEAGIARQIIDVCTGQFKAPGAARLVGLRVSALSSVDPEALRFCFDTLKRDTSLDAVTLQIEWGRGLAAPERPTAIDLETLVGCCPTCARGIERGCDRARQSLPRTRHRGGVMAVSLSIERKILSENDRIAAGLRNAFERRGLHCLNLISPTPRDRHVAGPPPVDVIALTFRCGATFVAAALAFAALDLPLAAAPEQGAGRRRQSRILFEIRLRLVRSRSSGEAMAAHFGHLGWGRAST